MFQLVKTKLDPIDFHCVDKDVFQNILYCVPQKKKWYRSRSTSAYINDFSCKAIVSCNMDLQCLQYLQYCPVVQLDSSLWAIASCKELQKILLLCCMEKNNHIWVWNDVRVTVYAQNWMHNRMCYISWCPANVYFNYKTPFIRYSKCILECCVKTLSSYPAWS